MFPSWDFQVYTQFDWRCVTNDSRAHWQIPRHLNPWVHPESAQTLWNLLCVCNLTIQKWALVISLRLKQMDGLVRSRGVFSKGKKIMRWRACTHSQPKLPLEDCLEHLITNWNRRHSKVQWSLTGVLGWIFGWLWACSWKQKWQASENCLIKWFKISSESHICCGELMMIPPGWGRLQGWCCTTSVPHIWRDVPWEVTCSLVGGCAIWSDWRSHWFISPVEEPWLVYVQ